LDVAKQKATVNSEELELTSTEFLLLKLLMISVGDLVTKTTISEQILGRRLAAFDRSIDMHVSNIRKKLAAHNIDDPIKTVRGSGYIFRNVD
jgi:two-component system response regulator CpxR